MGQDSPVQDNPINDAQVSVWQDRARLMEAAAQRIVAIGQQAIAARGRFAWALSGGSTPRQLYALLATQPFASALDWRRVAFFWGDERCVAPDHPDSNYRMARQTLLDPLHVDPAQLYRMHGEDEPARAAAAYEAHLREFFRTPLVPSFDLVLLGLGADGHTASLFPGSAALDEAQRWVVPNRAPTGAMRLTLTFPVLNAADHVLFLVAGSDKTARVRQVLQDPADMSPARRVHPVRGRPEWLLDVQAAGGLA